VLAFASEQDSSHVTKIAGLRGKQTTETSPRLAAAGYTKSWSAPFGPRECITPTNIPAVVHKPSRPRTSLS
jgi:hypothetical protein